MTWPKRSGEDHRHGVEHPLRSDRAETAEMAIFHSVHSVQANQCHLKGADGEKVIVEVFRAKDRKVAAWPKMSTKAEEKKGDSRGCEGLRRPTPTLQTTHSAPTNPEVYASHGHPQHRW